MNELDAHHVEAFERARRDGFPAVERGDFLERMSVRLSWLRTKAPVAFRELCLTDNDCASIAVQRKWVFDADADAQIGWGDLDACLRSLRIIAHEFPEPASPSRKALMECFRAALERYAPDNLYVLDVT